MFKIIHYLLDRVVFAVGLLLGSQIPAFMVQYQQRIAGRLEQLRMDLALFQDIADRFFDGQLLDLIQYHKLSNVAAFQAEGMAVEKMLLQEEQLTALYQSLQTHLPGQMLVILNHHDWAGISTTAQDFQPSLIYSVESLIATVLMGFLLVLIYQLLVRGIRKLTHGLRHWRLLH